MYKAIQNIGEYKVGDEVPEEEAELWLKMYKEAPVKKVSEESSKKKNSDKKSESKKDEEDTENPVNPMLDDYLNRNADVVKKAIRVDSFDRATLEGLLKIELTDKQRKPIIEAINVKLKSLG